MTARRWAALPVLLVAVFVTTLDFYVANLAIPSIRADLGASDAAIQFVIAGYGLAYAAGLIVSGRLGDLLGHRRVFATGLALFTLASAGCGLAGSPATLVTARIAQGIAAALLAPQVLTLLGALYPGPDRPRAFGWYGTTVGLAGLSGQVIGGLLVAADPMGLGWRACFLINLPLGLAALACHHRLLPQTTTAPGPALPHVPPRSNTPTEAALPRPSSTPETAPPSTDAIPRTTPSHIRRLARELDVTGAVLVAAGLVAVVLPLAEGREQGWPLWGWLSLATAPILLTAFVRRQQHLTTTGRIPLLDLTIFTNSRFAWGLIAVALLFGTSAGLSFVLALYLQDGLDLSPLAAGTVCTALNAGFFVASLRRSRFGAPVLLLGLGLLYGVVDGGATPCEIALALLVTGAGMGLLMSPLISSVLSATGQERAGTAAGVLGTVQETGGVLGGTVTGAVLFGALADGWDAAAQAGLSVLIAGALGVLAYSAWRPRRGAPALAGFHVKQDRRPDRPGSVEC